MCASAVSSIFGKYGSILSVFLPPSHIFSHDRLSFVVFSLGTGQADTPSPPLVLLLRFTFQAAPVGLYWRLWNGLVLTEHGAYLDDPAPVGRTASASARQAGLIFDFDFGDDAPTSEPTDEEDGLSHVTLMASCPPRMNLSQVCIVVACASMDHRVAPDVHSC